MFDFYIVFTCVLLGENGKLWKPGETPRTSVVCSRHFTNESFFMGPKRRRLKPQVVPSIFEDYPIHKQKKVSERRKIKKHEIFNMPPPSMTSLSMSASVMSSPPMLASFMHPLSADLDMNHQSSNFPGVNTKDASTNTNITVMQMKNQKTQIRNLQEKIRRINKNVAKYKQKIKELEKENKNLRLKISTSKSNEIEESIGKTPKADFLKEQLKAFGKKKNRWGDNSIRYAILLHSKSPSAYNFIRDNDILSLPSRSTLKRYVGFTTGNSVTTLMKQRLFQEAARTKCNAERFGSIIIDEMSIKSRSTYNKFADEIVGDVSMNGLENKIGLENVLANRLLCFVFSGLSTRIKLPVAYYFTKSLKGEHLYALTIEVLREVEKAGFVVVRIVTDNHLTNVKLFSLLSNEPSPKPVIAHPLDSERFLFLSFDVCHILKNIRSLFLSRNMQNGKDKISSSFLKMLYDLQKDCIVKPVRNLTAKHLYPTSFEKMHVGRAVRIFKEDIIGALTYLHQHGQRFGINGFKDASKTIEFLSIINKWFTILNVKNTSYFFKSRNDNAQHFSSIDDERLIWLQNDFLSYLEAWKANCSDKSQFLSKETYMAIKVTTESAVSCIKYLLEQGFQYVLTRKFTSDDIEILFSYVRRLSGSNDQTDALSAIQSLHKILVTGKVSSSLASNIEFNDDGDWMSGNLFQNQSKEGSKLII